jgi:RNA polymerase sigma factor for flagellar operon FliA
MVEMTDMGDVWRRFKSSTDPSLRNVLVENYLPIVKYNAKWISANLPLQVDQDDLISAGVFGLIHAIEAYDLDRGIKFETYCAPRIRGAIVDELRRMDWVPRLVRIRATKLERITRQLESTLGRPPAEAEIAERLGLSRVKFEKLVRDATAITSTPLSVKYGESDDEINIVKDKCAQDPLSEIQKKDLQALFTRGLNRMERLTLILYYYEGMTLREIGKTLGFTPAHIAQIHSAVLVRLQERWKPQCREFFSDKVDS